MGAVRPAVIFTKSEIPPLVFIKTILFVIYKYYDIKKLGLGSLTGAVASKKISGACQGMVILFLR